jgi:hypothetical protein
MKSNGVTASRSRIHPAKNAILVPLSIAASDAPAQFVGPMRAKRLPVRGDDVRQLGSNPVVLIRCKQKSRQQVKKQMLMGFELSKTPICPCDQPSPRARR